MNEQDILRTELRWSAIVAAAVAIIVGVIVVSSAAMVLHPPSNVERIDPTTLHVSGEFVESNLGTDSKCRRLDHRAHRRDAICVRSPLYRGTGRTAVSAFASRVRM